MSQSEPLTGSAHTFFKDAERDPVPWFPPPDLNYLEDRKTCRWCLNPFDVSKQKRSTPERGHLRTNLKMSDNGTELVCCDACWQGAVGARILMMGRVVPADPEKVDNPLLRASLSK